MFELVIAQEIMQRNLVTVHPEMPVLPAISRMLKANISGAPVVDSDGNYLGVFSEKCSLNALTELVEEAELNNIRMPAAKDVMTKRLVMLTPDWDVFEAIEHILQQRISGAPVVDDGGVFLGVFSEKTAMQVLMATIHDSVPGANIQSFINFDRNRIVASNLTLPGLARKFQETSYRRLPVLSSEQLRGQISRRDVLRAELEVGSVLNTRKKLNPGMDGSVDSDNGQVGEYVDRNAWTIGPSTDLLAMAQLFLNSSYRRLPVLDENRRLLGQISRRDLLAVASKMLRPAKEKYSSGTLYLSQVTREAPNFVK